MEKSLRLFLADDSDDFAEINSALADWNIGEKKTVIGLAHALIFEMHGQGPGSQSASRFHRVFQQGHVVPDVEAGADMLAAELFEEGETFFSGLILVVFEGEFEA